MRPRLCLVTLSGLVFGLGIGCGSVSSMSDGGRSGNGGRGGATAGDGGGGPAGAGGVTAGTGGGGAGSGGHAGGSGGAAAHGGTTGAGGQIGPGGTVGSGGGVGGGAANGGRGGGGNGGLGGTRGSGGTKGGCGVCPDSTDSCTACNTCCPRGALCICPNLDAGINGGGGGRGADAGVTCSPPCDSASVCVETVTNGGAIIIADDAGACPPGTHAAGVDRICVRNPIYGCAPKPAACGATLTCACAATLCTAPHFCQSTSAEQVDCVANVP
jgi:hypothetical protein